jgi:hypothetical protein
MGRRILDPKLMAKLAKKLGIKKMTSVNVKVSQRAQRDGISSEAALIRLAREHSIGTATYMSRLDPAKRAEVRESAQSAQLIGAVAQVRKSTPGKKTASERATLKAAVKHLIQDPVLQDRCVDILLAKKHFDRPINQATLILEERIRLKASPLPKPMVGEDLVNYAFNEELTKTRLQVASKNVGDQRGFTQMIRGVVPTFRNPTHHHLISSFTREDAMQVCGLIDVLLRVVDGSTRIR